MYIFYKKYIHVYKLCIHTYTSFVYVHIKNKKTEKEKNMYTKFVYDINFVYVVQTYKNTEKMNRKTKKNQQENRKKTNREPKKRTGAMWPFPIAPLSPPPPPSRHVPSRARGAPISNFDWTRALPLESLNQYKLCVTISP